jgi:hypothetical protein
VNASLNRTREALDGLRGKFRELRVLAAPPSRCIAQGLAAASGKALGWMPAGGQIPAGSIARLLHLMNVTRSDLGQGVRTEARDGSDGILATAIRKLARVLHGIDAADMHGGPKLVTRRIYTSLKLRSRDNFVDAETLLKAHRMGASICRLEVEPLPRLPRRGAMRPAAYAEMALCLLRARLQANDPWGLNATPRNIFSPMALRRGAAQGVR